MADRMTRKEVWGYFERPLKNAVVAVKGQIACIDTADGALVPVSTATTLVPIGYFKESFTGNGTRVMRVELFKDVVLHRFDNDTVGTDGVEDADVMKVCYLKDGSTVTEVATGRSVAGRVWAANASHVLVELLDARDLAF